MSSFYSNIFVMDGIKTETIAVIDALLYQLVVLPFDSPVFCRVSEERGERFTRLTEILVGGVTFQSKTVQSLLRLQRLQRLQRV